MFTLILTPDQSCNWSSITGLLEKWSPAILLVAQTTESEARFSTELPTGEQERLSAILELKNILTPHGVSFSLEINHDTHCKT